MSYNGWANYETWCVNLWLSNDEGLQLEAVERVGRALADADEQDEDDKGRLIEVRSELKTWVVDELAPDLGATLWADLLGAALDEVDWYELAEQWITAAGELADVE